MASSRNFSLVTFSFSSFFHPPIWAIFEFGGNLNLIPFSLKVLKHFYKAQK